MFNPYLCLDLDLDPDTQTQIDLTFPDLPDRDAPLQGDFHFLLTSKEFSHFHHLKSPPSHAPEWIGKEGFPLNPII